RLLDCLRRSAQPAVGGSCGGTGRRCWTLRPGKNVWRSWACAGDFQGESRYRNWPSCIVPADKSYGPSTRAPVPPTPLASPLLSPQPLADWMMDPACLCQWVAALARPWLLVAVFVVLAGRATAVEMQRLPMLVDPAGAENISSRSQPMPDQLP